MQFSQLSVVVILWINLHIKKLINKILTLNGTKYSKIDQIKFAEDSL